MAELPRTETGKLQRYKLRSPLPCHPERSKAQRNSAFGRQHRRCLDFDLSAVFEQPRDLTSAIAG